MNDDTISRAAAIDAVMDEFKRIPTSAIRAKTRIEALPSAQPEIIRCGECSFFKSSTSINGECVCNDMWMSLYGETPEVDAIVVHKDHYCGYAERRADGSDFKTGGD